MNEGPARSVPEPGGLRGTATNLRIPHVIRCAFSTRGYDCLDLFFACSRELSTVGPLSLAQMTRALATGRVAPGAA
jgi:hypothetical protein